MNYLWNSKSTPWTTLRKKHFTNTKSGNTAFIMKKTLKPIYNSSLLSVTQRNIKPVVSHKSNLRSPHQITSKKISPGKEYRVQKVVSVKIIIRRIWTGPKLILNQTLYLTPLTKRNVITLIIRFKKEMMMLPKTKVSFQRIPMWALGIKVPSSHTDLKWLWVKHK